MNKAFHNTMRPFRHAGEYIGAIAFVVALNVTCGMKILDVPQSGSSGGVTSSRNAYGQYRRARATPVNPNSTAQGLVRARLAANSAAWRTLTDAQIAGWRSLSVQMVRSDSLGQSYKLSAFQAFCSVNNNKALCGDAIVLDAPAIVTPSTVLTVTVTTTGGTLSVAFTPTPMPAATRIAIYASPQGSAGKSYQSDLRFLSVSAAAAASPINLLAAYTAKFGVPVVGNRLFFALVSIDGGFQSGPFLTSKVVTA